MKSQTIRWPHRWQINVRACHHNFVGKDTKVLTYRTPCILLAFFLLLSLACQTAKLSELENSTASPTPVVSDDVNRKTSEPYTGDLSIFEDAQRDKNLQINRVMDILKISNGKSVADVGAGSGWFTVRAAKRVGDKGQVFAVEINQGYIDHINDRAKKEGFANIKTILATEDNPLLGKQTVDAVLILKTYHEIAQPIRYMKNLRVSLRDGALVGIIDRNGNGDDHGIKKEIVVSEAKQAGYLLKDQYDFIKPDGMDYFLVFQVQK